MMTTARDEILNRIRARSTAAEVEERQMPAAWRSLRRYQDLAFRFEEALVAAKGEVIRADSWDGALVALANVLEEAEAARVVVSAEPWLADVAWQRRFPGPEWFLVGASAGDLRGFCASADVGISGASVALAETGTVGIVSGDRTSRLATLLPPVHIVLLPLSQLTPDLFTWAASRQGKLPANLVFVSGPSKSADIEQTLAVGVHGPGRFVVILFQDK